MRQDSRLMPEIKTTPYQLRRWEIFSDPTPVMGENDGSVSLALFGARKV
jgi:mediator of RNA polymerase II transcription subunit 12